MSTYIFDSNPIYYLSNLHNSDPNKYDRIISKIKQKKLTIKFTPISVIELVSAIYDNPSLFEKIKTGANFLVEVGAKSLPDFEQRMAEIVTDSRTPLSEYNFWNEIIFSIANAKDSKNLQEGFDDYKTATKRVVYANFLATFREDYENKYMTDLLTAVRQFNPNYDKKIRKNVNTRLPKSEWINFEKFISSEEWELTLLSIIEYRSKKKLPKKNYEMIIIKDRIRYYKAGYETIIRKIVTDGYRPSIKNKNDYNDIHLLLYIDDYRSQATLVSSDNLINHLPIAQGKIISFDSFISQL